MVATADSVIIELQARMERYRREVDDARRDFERNMDRIERAGRSAEGAGDGLARSVGTLKGALAPLAGAIAAVGLASLGQSLIKTAGEFQKLQVQLEVATGSANGAKQAFGAIQKLAAETPFSVEEVTKAFIALKNFGLDPSAAAIISYGNTAGALGKTLDDVVQAVADAATGEFERLKEFGIRASAQGDKVAFTFKGVTETVDKNATSIEGYLKRIGDTNFAGGMEKQSKTLGGALSNLGDTTDQLAVKFGEGGFSAAVLKAVEAMTSTAGSAGELATELGGLAGDAITAAQQIIESFGGVSGGADTMVREIRASLSGLGEAFAGSFDGLQIEASYATKLASDTFDNFIRNTLRELDAFNNFVKKQGPLGGAIASGTTGKTLDRYDAARNARMAELEDAKATRTMSRILATPLGGGSGGDILGSFRDRPVAGGGGTGKIDKGAIAKAAREKAAEEKKAAKEAHRLSYAGFGEKYGDAVNGQTGDEIGKGLDNWNAEFEDKLRTAQSALEKAAAGVNELVPDPAAAAGLADIADQAERAARAGSDFGNDLASSLADAAINGRSLGDALVNSIKRAAVEFAASSLFKLFNGGSLSGSGGFLKGAGKLLGFAGGGRPAPGVPYLVGEKGPEVRIDGPGQIIPNDKIGGGTSVALYQTFNNRFDVGLESVDQRIAGAAPVLLQAAQRGTFEALRNSGIGLV